MSQLISQPLISLCIEFGMQRRESDVMLQDCALFPLRLWIMAFFLTHAYKSLMDVTVTEERSLRLAT